jgi:phenylpyruvate tautomerase PptA (4-oxalocrotonate tautomerase family)
MPLLTLDITSAPLTLEQRQQVQQGLTHLMASRLGKVAHLTVVQLRESPDRSLWSVGGRPPCTSCCTTCQRHTGATGARPNPADGLPPLHPTDRIEAIKRWTEGVSQAPSFDSRRLVLSVPVRLRGAQDFAQDRRGISPSGQREGEHQLIGLGPFP